MRQKFFLIFPLSLMILTQLMRGMATDEEVLNTDPPIYPDDTPAVTMPLEDSNPTSSDPYAASTSLDRPKKIHQDDRILDLEDQVRELRGQIEELHHQLQSIPSNTLENSHPKSHEADLNSDHKTSDKSDVETPKFQETSAAKQYEEAQDYLSQQAYPEAERVLKQLIDKYPQDPLVINAYYWLGESYYIQKEYPRAAIAFADVYKTYRTFKKEEASDNKSFLKGSFAKVPEALIKLTLTLKAMGKTSQACTALAQLHTEFPQLPVNIQKKAETVEKDLPQCMKDDKK